MTLEQKLMLGSFLGVAAFVAFKGFKGAGAAAGGAVVDLVDGVISGTVIAAGSTIGIPDTTTKESISACSAAMDAYAAGDVWSAPWKVMTYCDASTYLKWAASGGSNRSGK